MKFACIILLLALAVSCAHHRPCQQNKQHAMMMQMDLNKDGKISQSEFTSHTTAKFKEKDLNNDGFITEDEWQKGSNCHCKMR